MGEEQQLTRGIGRAHGCRPVEGRAGRGRGRCDQLGGSEQQGDGSGEADRGQVAHPRSAFQQTLPEQRQRQDGGGDRAAGVQRQQTDAAQPERDRRGHRSGRGAVQHGGPDGQEGRQQRQRHDERQQRAPGQQVIGKGGERAAQQRHGGSQRGPATGPPDQRGHAHRQQPGEQRRAGVQHWQHLAAGDHDRGGGQHVVGVRVVVALRRRVVQVLQGGRIGAAGDGDVAGRVGVEHRVPDLRHGGEAAGRPVGGSRAHAGRDQYRQPDPEVVRGCPGRQRAGGWTRPAQPSIPDPGPQRGRARE